MIGGVIGAVAIVYILFRFRLLNTYYLLLSEGKTMIEYAPGMRLIIRDEECVFVK